MLSNCCKVCSMLGFFHGEYICVIIDVFGRADLFLRCSARRLLVAGESIDIAGLTFGIQLEVRLRQGWFFKNWPHF